jgi:hypothetical protein
MTRHTTTTMALLFSFAVVAACSSGQRDPVSDDPDHVPSAINSDAASNTSAPPYDRSDFSGDWGDADGDCLNTRMEILAEWSSSPVQYDESGCRVVSGQWISEYTDKTIFEASEIDIDHVVPLAYAWKLGAYDWSPEERQRFFDDGANLLPVELSLNRAKGDSPPSEWMPPRNQCRYISRFKRVTIMYHLQLPETEEPFIQLKLQDCE